MRLTFVFIFRITFLAEIMNTLDIDHKWLLDTHVELEHLVEGAVDKDMMGCIFESCTYSATDKCLGTKEELLFVL